MEGRPGMKKFIRVSFTVIVLIIACAMPGQAANSHGGGRGGAFGHFHGGGRGGAFGHFHGGGRGWGPGWGAVWGLGLWDLTVPYYGYPYYGYPYYTYYGQAPVIVQQPTERCMCNHLRTYGDELLVLLPESARLLSLCETMPEWMDEGCPFSASTTIDEVMTTRSEPGRKVGIGRDRNHR